MEVEQVDREAAAELYLALDGDELTPSIVAEADRHRRGDYDLSPAVQAFARHRIQALEMALKLMGCRRASAVAWREETPSCDPDWLRFDGAAKELDSVASAIRTRFLHPGDGVNDPAANGD